MTNQKRELVNDVGGLAVAICPLSCLIHFQGHCLFSHFYYSIFISNVLPNHVKPQ